jgi:hypothetical protein
MNRAIVVVLLAVGLSTGVAQAHELSTSRFAAPIPLTFLFVGAGLTVALTAALLAYTTDLEPNRPTARSIGTLPPSLATGLRLGARVLFLLVFLGAIVVGLVGRQVTAENLATVFVWPVWLKGVGLLSLLVGSPWPVLSPWRTLYDGLCHLEGADITIVGKYPTRLADWPALLGFLLVVGIIENLTVIPRSPQATALLVSVYALVMLLGGLAYGSGWFRHADFFAVLYRLLGRVAPIPVTQTGTGGYRLSLRSPWQRCTAPVDDLALVAFIIALVYTVSFDGFTNTPEFQTLLFGLRDITGLGPAVSVVLYLVGYGGFLSVFWAIAALTNRAGLAAGSHSAAMRTLAPTVLPIAAAYELAHNYPFVIQNLGQLIVLVGQALQLTLTVRPLAWLSLPAFWSSQVVVIIAGHIIAVVAAHFLLRRRIAQRAGRSHVPLTVLMVGYTMLSLWIISRPVVS